MRNHSVLHALIWMMTMVFAFTFLSALGTAVFVYLGGVLYWVLDFERVSISFLWATTSGAMTGFLMGILWAIDRALNRGVFLSPSLDDSHPSATLSEDGKAPLKSFLHKPPKKAIDAEFPASGE